MDAKFHQTSVLANYKYKKSEIKAKKKEKKGTDLWVAKGELQRVKSSEFMYMDMYRVLILLHKGDTCNPV